ncbi:hypothetical protein ITP53_33615 [Nonomuraea sp. K274]|uniref:Uncharacterized protein n=1 Tax=Nonomuraea cypriaca TaxID=1187855 RepID=A0A931F2D5_9ACTN|nr:hypothetical protein [Nonomuraea cypriaca]MBF8190567.1 hypothetical protein [Nonomuraea cypriaca]
MLLVLATQRMTTDAIPGPLKGVCSLRWAVRCPDTTASNAVLGQGAAGAGYNASDIPRSHRGVGILDADGSDPVKIRSYFLDDAGTDLADVAAVAYELRRAAGTLPPEVQAVAQDPRVPALPRQGGGAPVAAGLWLTSLIDTFVTVCDSCAPAPRAARPTPSTSLLTGAAMRFPLRTLASLAALSGAFLISAPAPAQASTDAAAAATYRGEGDDVVRIPVTSAAGIVKASHSGESNFIVWALDSRGRTSKLLSNGIGDYRGRVLLPAGARYATIEADGAWSISR